MSIGEAWWFVGPTSEIVPKRLFEYMQDRGFLLRHPGNGGIWVIDDWGSRSEVSLEFIFAEWTAHRQVTMQLWTDADRDVVVSLERERSLLVFGFDGFRIDEAVNLAAALLLGAATMFDTRALVIDRYLPDTGEEWSRVAAGSDPPPYEPDLLLLRRSDGEQTLTLSQNSWLA